MPKMLMVGLLLAPVGLVFTTAATAGEIHVAHMVYFELKDDSEKAKKELVAACNKYLAGHEGTVYFSAGVLAKDLKRPVNDRKFDVALHLVFKSKAAHDKYQDDPRHLRFIKEYKDNWKKVRVFDAYVSPGEKQSRLERGRCPQFSAIALSSNARLRFASVV